MESNKSIFWNMAMKWGLYVSLVVIVESLVFYFVGKTGSQAETMIQYLIIVTGIVLATKSYKQQLPGDAPFTYSNALGFGVSLSLFTSIVLAVYTFIMYQFVAPELMDKFITDTEEAYLNSGMSEEMVEQQVKMFKMLLSPGLMAFAQIFNWIITGFIFSLLTSLFLKKSNDGGFQSAMREINEDE